MLTVNDLAIQSRVPAHVVRYYTRIGLIHPQRQQENGYRLFSPEDANRLRFIRLAKQLGFTLNEIKEITQHADMKESPCQEVRKIIQDRIVENRQKIEQMLKLQNRMESALQQWQDMPDGNPDGHSVCHLIESIQEEE
ncbi:MAG: MerR family transcriptional regulator [Gammaproteobacteria bacterium]|nr:MerR family transcriptional regulator [Gammaproteobacteria bacterium]